MSEFRLANSMVLLLLGLVPLLVLWHLYVTKKGKRFIFYSSKRLLRPTDKTFKAFFIKHLFYVKLLAFCFLVLALARPQILNYFQKESKKGIDILITLDVSGSMAAVDFRPKNRLEVAKDVISDFIDKRTNDRMGLVIFAGLSYTQCPITIDHDVLREALSHTVFKDISEDGTALGMALATSVNRIRQNKLSKTKIIILLTDGVNNRGEIDPRDAAKIAETFNIKVYTIGVGTRGKAPYPVIDQFGNEQYIDVDVTIDEELLKEIANRTGGLYFRATDQEQLKQIFAEIDRWEKTEIDTQRYSTARDLYGYFLLVGFLLLFCAELGKRTLLRTLP